MFSVQQKQRIVLSVLRGEASVAEAARRNKCSETSIAKWRDRFVRVGIGALEASSARGPSTREAQLERELAGEHFEALAGLDPASHVLQHGALPLAHEVEADAAHDRHLGFRDDVEHCMIAGCLAGRGVSDLAEEVDVRLHPVDFTLLVREHGHGEDLADHVFVQREGATIEVRQGEEALIVECFDAVNRSVPTLQRHRRKAIAWFVCPIKFHARVSARPVGRTP
jgi:transposase-like protein